MIRIRVSHKFPIPIDLFWERIIDLKSYPKYFKYIKDVKIEGEPKVGKTWTDKTNMFLIPLSVRHKIIKFEKNKEVGYDMTFPLIGGKMEQRIKMVGSQRETRIIGEVGYNLGNPILNRTIGSLIKLRWQEMIRTAIERLKKDIDK